MPTIEALEVKVGDRVKFPLDGRLRERWHTAEVVGFDPHLGTYLYPPDGTGSNIVIQDTTTGNIRRWNPRNTLDFLERKPPAPNERPIQHIHKGYPLFERA